MNWLTEHLENLKEMVKDCVAGMSSKDKVIACGITSIAAITIAYIFKGGGDNGASSHPDLHNDSDDDEGSE